MKTISYAGRRDKLGSVVKKTHRLTHCYRMRANDGACHWNASEIMKKHGVLWVMQFMSVCGETHITEDLKKRPLDTDYNH